MLKHNFVDHAGSWRCTVCQWNWPTRRRSECPGIPRYDFDHWPQNLQTLPQLKRKRLQPSGPPDGCYYKRLSPHWLPLYDAGKASTLNLMPWSRLPFRFNIMERFRNKQSCQWCRSERVQEGSRHTRPRDLCHSCPFEQAWLMQCMYIQAWAQERLRDKEALILDTETIDHLTISISLSWLSWI
jgi:hypothetical protein